jgi:hypothetical protein
MSRELEASLICIRNANGKPVGVGFLVDGKRALTCAHVIQAARAKGSADDTPLQIDFPHLPGRPAFSARLIHLDEADDVAGLELLGQPPADAVPVRLVRSADLWEHKFRAFGFPAGLDGGVWASGRILAPDANGWLQIEDTKATGYAVQPGFSGGPLWDEQEAAIVGMVVAADSSPGVRAAFGLPADLLIAAWPALAEQAITPCPYRGLFAFREQDAALFFGWERYTEKLLESVQAHSFVAVVGPSGSGKSSVVFAGLLPKLRALGEWACVDFRPGAHPFESLALALLPLLEPQMSETSRMLEMRTLAAALQSGDIRLEDVLGRVLQKCAPACRLLLIADQFEELYTLCPDPETRSRFVDCLLSVAQLSNFQPSNLPTILITLRADFLGQALAQRSFADALQDAQQLIGPMNADELRQAIEQPAGVRGVRFEAGLVERILADLASQPGALPLLEFALTLLWQRQESGRLTHAAYDAIGCVEGALAHYADQVLKRLSADEQQVAQRVFTQLVQPGRNTEDTRRLARRTELPPAQWELLKRLADARLVVTDQTAAGEEAAEVVHEALIQRWGQLRQWMDADRAFRNWQERLRASLGQWQQSQKDPGALLRGAPLAEAEGWLERRLAALGESETAYIAASLRARRKEQAASRLRWLAISAVVTLAVFIATLTATGNLNRFLYPPLPMDMVTIPAGEFWMGCDPENPKESCQDDELPRHQLYLDAYQIGVYEVTNRQYAQCVRARECAVPYNPRYLLDEYASTSWHK